MTEPTITQADKDIAADIADLWSDGFEQQAFAVAAAHREAAVAELRAAAQRYLDAQKAREQWPADDVTKRFDAMLHEIDSAESALVAALSQKETSHDD